MKIKESESEKAASLVTEYSIQPYCSYHARLKILCWIPKFCFGHLRTGRRGSSSGFWLRSSGPQTLVLLTLAGHLATSARVSSPSMGPELEAADSPSWPDSEVSIRVRFAESVKWTPVGGLARGGGHCRGPNCETYDNYVGVWYYDWDVRSSYILVCNWYDH